MTIGVGAHTAAFTSGAVTSLTSGSVTTSTSGSTFVVAFAWDSAASAPTPTDSKSNTYTQIGTTGAPGNGNSYALFYCQNGTGGTGHTVTVSFGSALDIGLFFVEVTGGLTSGILDQSAAWVQDTSSPYTTNTSGTTTQANELALAFFFNESVSGTDTTTFGGTQTFTAIDSLTNANVSFTGASGQFSLTSTGTVQAQVTSSGAGSTGSVGALATFKQTGGGATVQPLPIRKLAIDTAIDEPIVRAKRSPLVSVDAPGFVLFVPPEEQSAPEAIAPSRKLVLPSGVASSVFIAERDLVQREPEIIEALPRLRNTPLLISIPVNNPPVVKPRMSLRDHELEEPAQRKRGRFESVDKAPLNRINTPEREAQLDSISSLRRLGFFQSVDAPPPPKLARVDWDFTHDTPQRKRGYFESVDSLFVRRQPVVELEAYVDSPQRKRGYFESVDNPPLDRISVTERDSVDESIQRRSALLPQAPAVVNNPPPSRLARVDTDVVFDVGPRARVLQPTPFIGTVNNPPPPRLAVVDRNLDLDVPARRLPVPLPSGAIVQPTLFGRRQITESDQTDQPIRLRASAPSSVDTIGFKRPTLPQESPLGDLAVRTRLTPVSSVDAPPARRNSVTGESISDESVLRVRGLSPVSVDNPIGKSRSVTRETQPDDIAQRHAFGAQLAPVVTAPQFGSVRRPIDAVESERVVRALIGPAAFFPPPPVNNPPSARLARVSELYLEEPAMRRGGYWEPGKTFNRATKGNTIRVPIDISDRARTVGPIRLD